MKQKHPSELEKMWQDLQVSAKGPKEKRRGLSVRSQKRGKVNLNPTRRRKGMPLTTEPVELPGVTPAGDPVELLENQLWQGGYPVDYEWIKSAGLNTVVDVSDIDAHPPKKVADDLTYIKVPLIDEDSVSDHNFLLHFAGFIRELLENGHKIFLHCTFGRNRSGLLAALIVREVLGLSGEEALTHVQVRRERAVNNETFAEWLHSLPRPERALPRTARTSA